MKILYTLIGSAVSAFLLTLASPGNDLWPLAYFALVPLLLSIRKTGKGALGAWIFGFIYYIVNAHWVTVAVSDFGNAPYFIGFLALAALASILAAYWSLFGYLYVKRSGSSLLMAGVIVALEVAKSNLFSGFPMLNLSHTQYNFLPAIQSAEVTGAFGVSLIIAYSNLALTALISDKNKQSIIFALLLAASSFIYGFSVQNRHYAGEDLNVTVIQPAYSQADKWVEDKKFDIMALVNGMVREVDYESTDLIVLPETVYPAFLDISFAGYHMLSVTGEKTPLIAGGLRNDKGASQLKYYNSVFMFNKDNVTTYDKRRLVPFGEYFPMKTLFKPINYYFFKGAEDFSKALLPTVFSTEKFKAAPLICYESMYSRLVRDQVLNGADVLTVVTNDSWFGQTNGPAQHLAADVMRSVEFRKPVIRAAQSGISACIDATGKITDTIPLGQKGSLNCKITTHRGETIFAVGGYGWLAVFLFAAWYINRRKSV